MPRKVLPCFSPQKLLASKYAEMGRQLKGQEQGLNDMTVEDYLRAREALDLPFGSPAEGQGGRISSVSGSVE